MSVNGQPGNARDDKSLMEMVCQEEDREKDQTDEMGLPVVEPIPEGPEESGPDQREVPEPGEGDEDQTPDLEEEPDGRALDEWVYLSGPEVFYNVRNGQTMRKGAFDLAMARHTPKIVVGFTDKGPIRKRFPASITLLNYRGGKVAHDVMYRPDLEQTGDEVFRIDGVSFVNGFMPHRLPGEDPTFLGSEDERAIRGHIENVLGPEEAKHIIRWMAFNVQHPGHKITWAPIIAGIQGSGKTLITRLVAAALGDRNVQSVCMESVGSSYNEWAGEACVRVFEEIHVTGRSRQEVMTKLKPLITNERIELVRKFKDGQQAVNVTNYLATTNHMDALPIDESDRRWCVLLARFKDKEELSKATGPEYWSRLHRILRDRPEGVRSWLLSVDLEEFDPYNAPATDHKRLMIEASRSEEDVQVKEAIEIGCLGVGPLVLVTDELNRLIEESCGRKMGGKKISRALENLGWSRSDPRVIRWPEKPRRVWVHKSYVGDRSPETLKELLDETGEEPGEPKG